MQSDSIAVAFDVTEDFRSRLPDRFQHAVFQQLRFEPGKETLGLGRVFVKYSLVYYPAATTKFNQLVLFPDGTAFDDVPDAPLNNFNAAAIRQSVEPDSVGQWKESGNSLVLIFPKEKRTLRKHPRG